MQQFLEFVVGEWPLFLALIIILALLARSFLSAAKSVRPAEATRLINHNGAIVVDVRTDKEFQEGHVLNALHIPLGVLQNRLDELQDFKTRTLVMVCRSGARSAQAASILAKQGFEDVYNLSGGMMAWQGASLPVTTAPTKARKPGKKIRPQGLAEVVVYTTRKCPFCTRAIDLLEAKGVGYKEIRIDGKPELRKEMEERAHRETVPQIFIGEVHVGGCDDMYELEDQGKLDGLLGFESNATQSDET
jgi:GrxC family glutaredoxin